MYLCRRLVSLCNDDPEDDFLLKMFDATKKQVAWPSRLAPGLLPIGFCLNIEGRYMIPGPTGLEAIGNNG